MKAREYYKILKGIKDPSPDKIEETIAKVMDKMCLEVDDVISKFEEDLAGDVILHIIDNHGIKWQEICKLHDAAIKGNKIDKDHPLYDVRLCDDHDFFRAYYISKHEEHAHLFNVDEYIENLTNKREEEKKENSITPHIVIPLEEITKENICEEVLVCLAALGSYFNAGMDPNWLRSLAFRVNFLQHWMTNGINYDEIKDFEDNPQKYAQMS